MAVRTRTVIFVSISVLLLFYVYGSSRVHSQYADARNGTKPPPILKDEPPPTKEKEEFADDPPRTRRLPLPSNTQVTEFLSWYTKLHEDQDLHKNRHVIYNGNPLWGFGNRYLGLLSAIVFGVATNRAILIGDTMMNSVIKWPFDASMGAHYLEGISKKEYSLQNDACFREKLPISLGTNLTTNDLDDMYPEQIVVFNSNCPAFHWIARNHLYTDTYIELGLLPTGTPEHEHNVHIAASLSYIFFDTVVPSIQMQLDIVLREWADNDYFVIGIQIRSAFTGNDPNVFDTFSTCARKLAANRRNVKYFLATDRLDIQRQAHEAFGSYLIDLSTYQLADGFGNAVIDSFLLGECDEIIVTSYSSFGVIGSLRRGKVPLESTCELANIEKGPSPADDDYFLW